MLGVLVKAVGNKKGTGQYKTPVQGCVRPHWRAVHGRVRRGLAALCSYVPVHASVCLAPDKGEGRRIDRWGGDRSVMRLGIGAERRPMAAGGALFQARAGAGVGAGGNGQGNTRGRGLGLDQGRGPRTETVRPTRTRAGLWAGAGALPIRWVGGEEGRVNKTARGGRPVR